MGGFGSTRIYGGVGYLNDPRGFVGFNFETKKPENKGLQLLVKGEYLSLFDEDTGAETGSIAVRYWASPEMAVGVKSRTYCAEGFGECKNYALGTVELAPWSSTFVLSIEGGVSVDDSRDGILKTGISVTF